MVAAREPGEPDREVRANVFFDQTANSLLIPAGPADVIRGFHKTEIRDASVAGQVTVTTAAIEAQRTALAAATGHDLFSAGEIHTHPTHSGGLKSPSVADILEVAQGESGRTPAAFAIGVVVEPGARGGPDKAYVMVRGPVDATAITRGLAVKLRQKLEAGKGGEPHTAGEAAWYLEHLATTASSALYVGDPDGELTKVEAVAPAWYAGWERRNQAAQDRQDARIIQSQRQEPNAPTEP